MDSARISLRVRLGQAIVAWVRCRLDELEASARRKELREGTRVNVHGLTVVVHRADAADVRVCLDKVQSALDVIARHDPRSLEAMRRHFDAILVWSWMIAANGSYLHSQRLCMLWSDYVRRDETEAARIAMTLIHELTHAKHMARARRVPQSRAHAEWLCIGAELAFIKKVPGTEHLRAAAFRRLERRADFYSGQADVERRIQHMEATGARGWARFARYLQRRRGRTAHGP